MACTRGFSKQDLMATSGHEPQGISLVSGMMILIIKGHGHCRGHLAASVLL